MLDTYTDIHYLWFIRSSSDNYIEHMPRRALITIKLMDPPHKHVLSAESDYSMPFTIYKVGTLPNCDNFSVNIVRNVVTKEFDGGHNLCFSPEGGCYCYIATHWEPLNEKRLTKLFFDSFIETYPELENDAENLANKALKYARLKYMKEEGLPSPKSGVINLKNGELWVSPSGHIKLKPHSASSGQLWCLKVDYNKDVKAKLFLKALNEIFCKCEDAADVIRHLLELMGYIITTSRDHPVIAMFVGSGSNGKSKLAETITRLLGPDTVLSRPMRAMNNDNFFDIDLCGKALYLDDDLAIGTTLADGRLKSLSEEKIITARPPGGRAITFPVKAVPLLLANHMPYTLDISYGMRRRVHLFKFDTAFTNDIKDEKLFPKIWESEISGILNLCLEGYQRLQERGDFLLPDEMSDNVDAWLAEVNVVPAFIENCCEIDPHSSIRGAELFNHFRSWAKECGYRNLPNRSEFYSDIESQGFKKIKPQNLVTFDGLGLTSFSNDK